MSAASTYLENELVDHVLRQSAYTSPTAVFIALFTGATTSVLPALESNNPTTEVSGGAYARYTATGGFSAPSDGATSNSSEWAFTQATASWGTVTCAAVVDDGTGTTWGTNVNVLVYAALDASKQVQSGDTFKFASGAFDLTIA